MEQEREYIYSNDVIKKIITGNGKKFDIIDSSGA